MCSLTVFVCDLFITVNNKPPRSDLKVENKKGDPVRTNVKQSLTQLDRHHTISKLLHLLSLCVSHAY